MDSVTDTGINELRAAIMKQAFDDWFALKRGRKIPQVYRESLLMFFRSEWAQVLCGDIDPMVMLKRLEVLDDGKRISKQNPRSGQAYK